jgi:hypothetical protein
MIIRDKDRFKMEVKKRIDKYVKDFPVYFYGNILINIIIVLAMIASLLIAAFCILYGIEGAFYTILLFVGLSPALKTTFNGFLRNIKILRKIEAGDYEFGVEDHEMDNAAEFIEDLPMKKEEVERMRVALSYNKLIDVLETARIIESKKGVYDIGLVFKYEIGDIFDNFYDDSLYKKNLAAIAKKRPFPW